MLLAFIFSCYAGSQYWILALVGAEGTGKSVLMDLLQSIIDPSVLKRDRAIKSENDLINVASNSFLILQDNLSAISHQMSDALCVLASGGAFRARKLFTDNEIEGASFRNPVILNGIVDLVSRPDLSDRVLPVSTQLIEGKERKDEEVLTEEFNRDLPVIFGGLLDCLSAGLKNLTATEIDGSVRMKRAMRFAVACGERLGYPIDSSSPLFQAVLSTQSTAKAQLAEYDIFDSTLLDYFSKQKKSKWHGTAKELHEALTKHLGIRSTQSLPQGFPKSARWMVDKLRRDLRLLKMMGLEVKLDAGYAHGHRKLIQILLLEDFSLPKAEIVAEASLKHDRQLGESKRGGKNSEEQNPKSKSERDLEACETNGEAKSESLAHQLDSLDPENSII